MTPQRVRETQKDFDLSTGQLSRCIPAGICHGGCRFGRMGCALTGNLNSVFYDGKAAENGMIFPISVFLIIDVFPPPLGKNRATSPPESRTHPFSTCPGGQRSVKPEAELFFMASPHLLLYSYTPVKEERVRWFLVLRIYKFCTAHDDWNVTGYRGLFCPLNKPLVTNSPCLHTSNKSWWSEGVRY